MDDITRLKKQVKLLVIVSTTFGILTMGLLVSVARLKSHDAWPDMTSGKLTVKELRIVSPDGIPKMLMYTKNNEPVLALIDQATDVRIVLSATTTTGGYLSLVGPDKAHNLNLSNGGMLMGEETQASFRLVAPSNGGPRLVLQDENGYSTTIGKAILLNKQTGTQSITSAASIVGSSKDSTLHWSLLKTQSNQKSSS